MRKMTFLYPVVLCILMGSVSFAKEESSDRVGSLYRAAAQASQDRYQILNINNLWTWTKVDGISNHSPTGDSGQYFPRGTVWLIYTDGIMWGGQCYTDATMTQEAPFSQRIRVGGTNYLTGNRGGRIIGTGRSALPDDPDPAVSRIYRIRRDYASMSTAELARDAAESFEVSGGVSNVTATDIQDILDRYKLDWENWPVDYGAPYIDRDGDGVYTAPPPFTETFTMDDLIAGGYDEPGIAGIDPDSPADQVVWTVYNDLNREKCIELQGSEPMGLETQITVWGYKRTDALGSVYFRRARLINKGGVDTSGDGEVDGSFYIDSMYVAQWSDPDLGSHADDLLACDTSLSIGYVYNGNPNDEQYVKWNLPPPAAGYDFQQGPAIASPGDTAVFDLKYKPGFKNLPMTSFSWFSAGSPISDPPRDYTRGTIRWYKMLRGWVPLDGPDVYYPFPSEVTESSFPYAGDPVAGTGHLDGQGTEDSFAPGDRRLNVSTGPFNLAPGDTQEVVVAVVCGIGADRFSSVAVMKFNDRFAQNTYDALFQVPSAPKGPDVSYAELDGKIILQWGSNTSRVTDTETTVKEPGGFAFEGYNVYQFPRAGASITTEGTKRIATYDLPDDPTVILDEQFDVGTGQILMKPVQFGSNSGIERFFELDRDHVLDIGKLYNGQEYYLAVTAYSRSTVAGYLPAALESAPTILTVVPKVPFGTVYNTGHGDTLEVTHVSGPSDGIVNPIVVDPTLSTGHTYEVSFDTTGGAVIWDLKDVTTGEYLLTDQTNQTGDGNYAIVDGMFLKVSGPDPGTKSVTEIAYAGNPVDPPDNVWHSLSSPNDANRFYISAGGGGGTQDRMDRNIANANSHDFEMRFTDAGGYYAWWYDDDTAVPVPFEVWDIGLATPDDPSDDVRCLSGGYSGDDKPGALDDFSNTDPYYGYPATDWIYIRRPDNDDGSYDAFAADVADGTADYSPDWFTNSTEVLARIIICDYGGAGTLPPSGTVIRWITNKPNGLTDVFTFTAPSPTADLAQEEFSAENVGVFPNPYYAFNPAERSKLARFVTFNNLPPTMTIRIFNLAGQLVRKLEKTDDPRQFMTWDLLNHDALPVASGMYIAYVEMTLPSGGETTKILKLAIIQEQEVLDVY